MTGQRAGRFAALPFSALHFNVRISGAGMPGGDLGFSEVVFPPFPVSSSAEAAQRVASDPALDPPAAAQNGCERTRSIRGMFRARAAMPSQPARTRAVTIR